jgi:mRNA interferase HicA
MGGMIGGLISSDERIRENPPLCLCIDNEHKYVYTNRMKRRDLERALPQLGWRFLRHGRKHDVWTDAAGDRREQVPRHTEVEENLARAILRRARRGN